MATLARRYAVKLVANMVSVPVYLVMEALLPRALGPRVYGDYNFATALFQQFSGFLDMGSSTCFYNALSRRRMDTALCAFYLRVVLLVFAALLAFGLIFLWRPVGEWALPDVPLWFAPLAAFWAFLTWLARVLRSMNDALGVTVASELWRASLSLVGAAALAVLFFLGQLNVSTLFIQQYLLLGLTAYAYWRVTAQYWRQAGVRPRLDVSTARRTVYSRRFFAYSHPLFVQAALSFAMLSAERWLLQWFDGSAQQGFYALSQKVGMACFLFVSAMTPLLMREFSIAWGKKDTDGMGSLLARFAPPLYAVAAYFSCFTAAEAREMVNIFGGAEFAAAAAPVQIMALYPMHQAYGQMAGSVFHAAGKTSVLRDVTACECVYGLLFAWFMLAPADLYGLNLGAAGLAIKTVATQFITVNLYLWLASRVAPFNFRRNVFHQLYCAALFLALAFAAREISAVFAAGFWRFFLSGVIYSFAVAAVCLRFPRVLGFSRSEAAELARRFLRRRS